VGAEIYEWGGTTGEGRGAPEGVPSPLVTRPSVLLVARLDLRRLRELLLAQLAYVTRLRGFAGHDALDDVEQHERCGAVLLRVRDGLRLHEDECDARVVRPAVAILALVAEPGPPVGLVEFVDEPLVAGDDRGAAHRHPLARAVLVVREVHVRVGGELLELVRLEVRHEPEVGPRPTLLRLHRPRHELPVRSPRGHHRDFHPVDQGVEIVELLLERDLVVPVLVLGLVRHVRLTLRSKVR